ncbi:MAG: PAS domain-containing protein [Terriglobales bacterium]
MSDLLDDRARFRAVLEQLPVGVYFLDRERRVRFWNRGAEEITGYLAQEVMGKPCRDPLRHCDRQGRVLCPERCPVSATFHDRHPQQAFVFVLHKQGHRLGVQVRTLPLLDAHDYMAGVAVTFEEALADSRPEALGRLMFGCLDPVTGIPSPRLTRAVLAESLAGLEQSHGGFGLLRIRVLGLDEFRSQHGPESVVPFLHTTAQTLRHSLDPENFLGRWGEDEFLAVLQSASPIRVAATAEKVWNLVSQSEVSWWGDRFLIEAVVAHAVARPGDTLESLFRDLRPSYAAAAGASDPSPGPVRG